MRQSGEHQVNFQPGLGRRMMVAAGIAFGLLAFGLVLVGNSRPPIGSPAAMSQSGQ